MPKVPKIQIGYFFEISQEKQTEVGFLHADKHERFLQIDITTFDGDGQAFPKQQVCDAFTISRKRSQRDEVYFLHADKHQSFSQVDFNDLIIKVS